MGDQPLGSLSPSPSPSATIAVRCRRLQVVGAGASGRPGLRSGSESPRADKGHNRPSRSAEARAPPVHATEFFFRYQFTTPPKGTGRRRHRGACEFAATFSPASVAGGKWVCRPFGHRRPRSPHSHLIVVGRYSRALLALPPDYRRACLQPIVVAYWQEESATKEPHS